MRKPLLNSMIHLALVVFVVLACLEATFRFVVPAAEGPCAFYDDKARILKFDTNEQRSGLYTDGNLAQIRAHWRVNNDGWNSCVDYQRHRTKPLVAIIGNSFIEAMQVDATDNIAGRMQALIGRDYDVYSFGVAGGSLAESLQIERYVMAAYKPDIVVFNVHDADIANSAKFHKPGLLYFSRCNGGYVEADIAPYRSNRFRRALRHSALVRYLAMNRQEFKGSNANTVSYRSTNGDAAGAAALVDTIFRKIKDVSGKARVVFLVNPPQESVYSDGEGRNPAAAIVGAACASYGFAAFDLLPLLKEDFRRNGRKSEFTHDDHWNSYGHNLRATLLYRFLADNNMLKLGRSGASD